MPMPAWNGGAHLPAGIRTVLGEMLRDLAWLVVDEGSRDDQLAEVA